MKYYFLSILILLLFPFVKGQNNTKKVQTLEIGESLPWFSLIGTDDKVYSPDNFKESKYLVVIFTCNHCPTAQAYESRIKELYKKYNKEGVGFVAISPNSNQALSLAECGYSDLDDSFESMKIRVKDIGLEFPFLYDGETSETSMKFGPVATPHVFIFDEERKLRYRGRIDDTENPYEKPGSEDTKNAIEALLQNQAIPVAITKTFGCSVKWPWKDEWTKQLIKNWANEEVLLAKANSDTLKRVIENSGENLRLVNVWATYCGPCLIEFPDLVDTYRMYNGRGFDFVTISMDRPKSEEIVLNFLKKNQASTMNYIWAGTSAYEAIDMIDQDWQGSLPYTMLIRPGGEIIFKYEGAVNILELRKAIVKELGRYFADD